MIHSICHWAAIHASQGWKCCNADILCDIVNVIAARLASITFHWVKGHSGNKHNDAVDHLANEGTMVEPHPPSYSCPPYRKVVPPPSAPLSHLSKVFTTLPEIPMPTHRHVDIINAETSHNSIAHRGRVKVRHMQNINLQNLLSCKNDSCFWKYVGDWLDVKKRPPQVTLSDIKKIFESQMNPPTHFPSSFNHVE